MPIQVREEVAVALRPGGAVVALESSVTAQGLPWPQNLESALACEAAVREGGAVPATIALIDGVIRVGLERAELERLARRDEPMLKVGSRDLAWGVTRKATGGTTVSAVCDIASRVGIRVFATGGIGGVHRGVAEHHDVSQDLWALSHFPVAVVCAGAKSILDLPKTLETLETLSVPVVGFGTREFPAFFSRTSGLGLEHRVDTVEDAAQLVRARCITLGQGGIVFAQPVPEAVALEATEIDALLEQALAAAEEARITGKAVTPYLLGALVKATGGRTLTANLVLLRENALLAGRIAAALARG